MACCAGKTHYGQSWFCTDLAETPANNIWALDITKPFPFSDEEFSYIFIEHGVEHIDFEGLLNCFSECCRILKKGGVLRFTSPTLENWIKYYLTNNEQTKMMTALATQAFIKPAVEFGLYSKALVFNNALRNFGHQLLLDFPTYSALLQKFGFTEIKPCALRQSSHSALQNMERHALEGIFKDYNKFEIQVVEATK